MFNLIPLRIVLLALFVGLLGGAAFWQGYSAANQSWQLKDAERIELERHAQIQNHIIARQIEQEQASYVAALDARYIKELSRAQTEIDRLRRDVRTGALRLSVKSASKPAALGVYDSATASGVNAATYCELDGQVADDLISITSEGDSAIRQLTALQTYVLTILEGNK
jgi:prophage endopeptidase